MTRKLGPLATLLLLVAALAAGCGGDDSSENSISGDTPAVTATTEDTATTQGTATTENTPAVGDSEIPDNVGQSIQACKNAIDNNSSVSEDIKGDLRGICEKVGEDPESIQEASREVCEKIVEDSVPAGDIRDQAKEACAAAGG